MNYHDRPEVSATQLKTILTSGWREYEARYVTRTKPSKQSDAFDFGNMLETVMLEPEKIRDVLYVMPSKEHYCELLVTADDLKAYCVENGIKPGKTKADNIAAILAKGNAPPIWDNEVAVAQLNRGNRIECSMQEWLDIQEIVALAKAHPVASLLFDEANRIQEEFVWRDDATGIACRCKVDVLYPGHDQRVLIDVKSTRHDSAEAFARDCRELHYWVQDIHYCMGTGASHMLFIGFSKVRPFRIFCHQVQPQSVERELLEGYYAALMQELAERQATNDWSDPGEGEVRSMTHPDWWHEKMRAKLGIEEMEEWDG